MSEWPGAVLHANQCIIITLSANSLLKKMTHFVAHNEPDKTGQSQTT